MKKIILIIAAMLAMASYASAASTYASGGTPPAGITFMPSKNVALGYDAGNLGGAGDNVVYSIASKNNAGDRIFAATSSSSAVAQSVSTAGTPLTTSHIPTKPTTASDSTITGGATNWSIL